MTKPRVLTSILSAVFFLTLVSSVRADQLHVDKFLEKFSYAESYDLTVLDNQGAETGYILAEHFESNNAKQLGFSIASVSRGPRLGIVKPTSPSVSQNPEPTAMVLLGTGLAAVAGFARKRSRKRQFRSP